MTRRRVALVAVAGILSACLCGAGAPPPAISIYVSAGDASGFVSPDSKDSSRDLIESLRKKKSIRLVDERGKADIWIRVDKRFMRKTGANIAVAVPDDTSVVASQAPVEEQVVVATLTVGDYSTEIVGANWWSWKGAAGQLANAIEKWVKENKEQVIARRPKGN